MKKNLLTMLFVMIFMCLFAVIASATTVIFVETVDNGDGTTTENELYRYETSGKNIFPVISHGGIGFEKYDDDGDALTWYATATINLESGETKYPVKKVKTKNLIVDNGDGILTQSEVNQINNLVSVTFDEDCGITEFALRSNGSGLFYRDASQARYFLFIDIPDSLTKMSDNCFRNATCLLEIGISENSRLTDFGAATFYGCTSMKSIYIPAGVTEFRTIDTPSEQYYDYGLFKNCQKLETINFAKDTSLESIGKCTFSECSSLKSITFPNTVKRVYPRLFNNCTALEYVNFGASLEVFDRTGDTYMSLFYNAPNVKTVIFPATFKAENLASDLHAAFPYTGMTIYYAGTEEEFIKLQEKFALATTSPGNKGITQATYNYISPCVAFYGGEHNINTTVEYESFLSHGVKVVGCVNNGCNENERTELLPLFTCLGYSVSNVGTGGIAIGYTVNEAAVEEYVELTDNSINYGVFVVAREKLGSDYIFDSEGTSIAGAICVEISQYGLSAFEIHISGFTDEYKDTGLVMGAYVKVTNKEGAEYSYMQDRDPVGDAKYSSVTYNQLARELATATE